MAEDQSTSFTPLDEEALKQLNEYAAGHKPSTKKPIVLEKPPETFVPIGGRSDQPLSMFPQGPAQPLTDEAVGHVMNTLRPYLSGLAGSAIGTLVGGPLGIPAGIAAYSAADMGQKYTNPKPELKPAGFHEEFDDSIKEGLINEVGGRIFGAIYKPLNAVRNAGMPDPQSILKLYPTTAQALENYGYHKLATLARFSEDFGAPAAKTAALDRAGGEGFTQALLLSNKMNSSGRFTKNVFQDPTMLKQKILDTLEKGISKNPTPGQFQTGTHYASQEAFDLLKDTSSPFGAIDDVIGNKDKLEKVLAVGQAVGPKNLNVRKDLQAYYWNRIFDEATTHIPGGGARIDPQTINDLWFNPKSGELAKNLETLYGKQTKQDLDGFMKNIIDSQSGAPNSGIMGKIKYLGGGFGIGGGLLTSLLGHPTGPMVASGLYLTNSTMGRLLTNPSVGKAVIDMAKAGPLSTGNKLLTRGIFNALEGSRVALLDERGQKTWGGVVRQPDGSYAFAKE